MPMNQVLTGLWPLSRVGGWVTRPIVSNYILQRSATQRDLLNRQLSQRETLYSDFIKEAFRLYADSMIHELEEVNDLVSLYDLVSRIRLLASEPVVNAAEEFVRLIVRHYGDPNLTVEQMRATVLTAKADPLDVFSFACRSFWSPRSSAFHARWVSARPRLTRSV